MGPTWFPAKSLPLTKVRLHSELAMLRPYFGVFTAWVSIATFDSTGLSSHVIPFSGRHPDAVPARCVVRAVADGITGDAVAVAARNF
jgi:hypothetical protein